MKYYYVKPWCRMGPYVVGILTGYLLYKLKGRIKIPTVRSHSYIIKLIFLKYYLIYYYFKLKGRIKIPRVRYDIQYTVSSFEIISIVFWKKSI